MIDGSILRAGLKVLAHALNRIAAEPHMICFWLLPSAGTYKRNLKVIVARKVRTC
jgi:hypothetical protein